MRLAAFLSAVILGKNQITMLHMSYLAAQIRIEIHA
jgi:hypothetical protein